MRVATSHAVYHTPNYSAFALNRFALCKAIPARLKPGFRVG